MLPERDKKYLHEKEIKYTIVNNPVNSAEQFLVIRDYDVGEHYTPQIVDLLITIPAGYPISQLDMFWVYPPVVKQDGGQPGQSDARLDFDGKKWQRFSRHRDGSTPWRPHVDGIASHLNFIRKDLNMGR